MKTTRADREQLADALEDVAASILRDGFDPEYLDPREGPTCFIGHGARRGHLSNVARVIGHAVGVAPELEELPAIHDLGACNLRALGFTTRLAVDFCVDLAAAVRAGCFAMAGAR